MAPPLDRPSAPETLRPSQTRFDHRHATDAAEVAETSASDLDRAACIPQFRRLASEGPSLQRPSSEAQLFNRASANQMFFDNSIQFVDIQVGVPGAFRIDDSHATSLTDAQTIDL